MTSLKVLATHCAILLASSLVEGGVLAPAVAPAVAPVAYTQIAPPAVAPFAASVNTFTRGLNVYAAPYAAGVLPYAAYPAGVIPRTVLPGPAPVLPAAVPAPLAPSAYAFSPSLLPAPAALQARSIHAVAPGYFPGVVGPGLPPAPFLA